MRCLYVDLDNTLLGRGASLLHDADGNVSLLGVRALEACHRAGVEVVPFSGRRQAQVSEPARLLGCSAYIFEAGCGLALDGELFWLTDELVPDDRHTIHDLIAATGAPRLLLEHYAGRLEPHEPWHLGRAASHLFRGAIDAGEADALLAEWGLGQLRLVDNGAVDRPSPTLPDLDLRAYHLIPAVASKTAAVRRHARARGYAREELIAVGDSREDLAAAEAVATFWLVANGLDDDPTIRELLAGHPNARVCEGSNGAGVYEAVVSTLAARRGDGGRA